MVSRIGVKTLLRSVSILSGLFLSGVIQAQSPRSIQPRPSTRHPVRPPAIQRFLDEKPDTSVFFTPSPRQIAAMKTLNARFRPRREELLRIAREKAAAHDKVAMSKVNNDLKAFQAEYDSAYRAILTPDQKSKFDRGKEIERAKSDSIKALHRTLGTSSGTNNSFSIMFGRAR